MPKKKPTKSKSLDITLYPEKWRKLLSEFVARDDKKQTLREWCKERDLPESTAYKWLTASAVKAEEKLQANQWQISKKSTSRLPADLPIQQAVFAEEYVTDFNATNAAKKAGYSEKTAGQLGHQLLKKPSVRAAVEERAIELLNGMRITTDDITALHRNIAFANMKNLADWNGGSVTLKDSSTLPDDVSISVAEVSQTKDGVKVKTKDFKGSLDYLTNLLRLKDAREAEHERIIKPIMARLKAGEITAVQAGMEIEGEGAPLPAVVSKMIDAELRIVEVVEEEIKLPPASETELSNEEYREFYAWKLERDRARGDAIVAELVKNNEGA